MTLLLARQPGERAFRRRGPVQAPGGTDGWPEEQAGRPSGARGWPPARPAGSPGPPEAAGGLACCDGGGLGGGEHGRRRGARGLGFLGGHRGRGGGALEVVEQLHLRVAGRVQRQELHSLLQAPGVALAVVLVQALGAGGGGGGEGCGETGRR